MKIHYEQSVVNVTTKVMTVIKAFKQYLMSYNKHEGETNKKVVQFSYKPVLFTLLYDEVFRHTILSIQAEHA